MKPAALSLSVPSLVAFDFSNRPPAAAIFTAFTQSLGSALLFMLLTAALISAAMAQTSMQGSAQNQRAAAPKKFDNWVIECNDQSVCQAIQSVTTKLADPAGKPAAGKPAANSAPRTFVTLAAVRKSAGTHQLLLELPFGIDLAKGVSVMVDGNPSYTLPFYTCYQRGCVVQSNLDAKRLAELNSGKYINLAFVGIESDNWRTVSIPLRGLTQALADIK
jgi:invasion protein IalB